MTLADKALLRVNDLVQRISLGDQRADRAAFDALDQVWEDVRLLHSTAEEAQVLQIERAHIQRNFRPADGTGYGIASTAAHHV